MAIILCFMCKCVSVACRDIKCVKTVGGGGLKSINVFFTGDENMLVIKTSPFLVPVNEPVLLNISLFRLDTGSIVFFMIGTIVKRSYLGTVNTVVAKEQRQVKRCAYIPTSKGKPGPEVLTCFSRTLFSTSSFPKVCCERARSLQSDCSGS